MRSRVLTVPVTFPPEDVPNGEMLSGLPLPDIRGTMGTFYYFATDLSRYEEGNTEFGGILKRLVFEGDAAQTELVGPAEPDRPAADAGDPREGPALADADQAKMAELAGGAGRAHAVHRPVEPRRRSRATHRRSQGQTRRPRAERQWSKWVDLEFRVNFLVRLHGMAQLLPGERRRRAAALRLAGELEARRPAAADVLAGLVLRRSVRARSAIYRTLGWAEATWPLNEGRIDEQTFMDDLYRAFDDRAQVILNRIDAGTGTCSSASSRSPTASQHMMWRLIDPTHPMYDAGARREVRRLDRARLPARRPVRRRGARSASTRTRRDGRLRPRLPLVAQGGEPQHLAGPARATWSLQGQQPGDKKLDDLFGGGGSSGRTWTGRRRAPTRWASARSTSTCAAAKARASSHRRRVRRRSPTSCAARLLDDGGPGRPARASSRAVYKRDDVYSGPFLENAPDLQVGFDGRLPRVVADLARRLAARASSTRT